MNNEQIVQGYVDLLKAIILRANEDLYVPVHSPTNRCKSQCLSKEEHETALWFAGSNARQIMMHYIRNWEHLMNSDTQFGNGPSGKKIC